MLYYKCDYEEICNTDILQEEQLTSCDNRIRKKLLLKEDVYVMISLGYWERIRTECLQTLRCTLDGHGHWWF